MAEVEKATAMATAAEVRRVPLWRAASTYLDQISLPRTLGTCTWLPTFTT